MAGWAGLPDDLPADPAAGGRPRRYFNKDAVQIISKIAVAAGAAPSPAPLPAPPPHAHPPPAPIPPTSLPPSPPLSTAPFYPPCHSHNYFIRL